MRRHTKSRKRRKLYKNEEEADFVIEEELKVDLGGNKNFFKMDNCSLSSLSEQHESICSTERDIVDKMKRINLYNNKNDSDAL